MRCWNSVGLVLLAWGCGGGGPVTSPTVTLRAPPPSASGVASAAPEPTTQESLRDQLLREVGAGKDVAIVSSGVEEGIFAVAADGTHKRLLERGPVRWISVDPRARVVWYGRAIDDRTLELRLIDLEASSAKSEAIGRVPSRRANDAVGVAWIDVRYPERLLRPLPAGAVSEEDGWGALLVLDDEAARFELVWVPSGGLDADRTGMKEDRAGLAFDPALAAPVAARLAALKKRGDGRPLAPFAQPVPQKKVTQALDGACDYDPRLKIVPNQTLKLDVWCRDTELVPGTALWRVLVGWVVGAGVSAHFRFYDPAARTFPGDELEFVGAIVAPSGRAALIDRGIADLATKKITLPEVYGDWLEGGTFLPERTSANPTVGAP